MYSRSVRSLTMTVVLLCCVVLLATLIGCAPNGAGLASGTKAISPTATPVVVDGVRYMTGTDSMFGFHVDIPAGLLPYGPTAEPPTGGDYAIWNGTVTYHGASEVISVSISAGTKGIDPSVCHEGTPVTVGSGITGYQTDDLIPNPASEAPPAPPGIMVFFVSRGIYVSMSLNGAMPRNTFMQRYGAIWAHMLASFMPGTYINPHPVCAG